MEGQKESDGHWEPGSFAAQDASDPAKEMFFPDEAEDMEDEVTGEAMVDALIQVGTDPDAARPFTAAIVDNSFDANFMEV